VCIARSSQHPLQAPKPAFGRIDTYKKLEKLGEGTYATVYKGRSAGAPCLARAQPLVVP
jgi:hypothetical protein